MNGGIWKGCRPTEAKRYRQEKSWWKWWSTGLKSCNQPLSGLVTSEGCAKEAVHDHTCRIWWLILLQNFVLFEARLWPCPASRCKGSMLAAHVKPFQLFRCLLHGVHVSHPYSDWWEQWPRTRWSFDDYRTLCWFNILASNESNVLYSYFTYYCLLLYRTTIWPPHRSSDYTQSGARPTRKLRMCQRQKRRRRA